MSEKDRNVDKAVGEPPRTKLNRREKAMIRVYILADMNMRGPLKQLKADWRVIKADSDQRISRAAEAIRSACPLPVLESEIEQIIEASELLGSLIDDDPKPERILQYWKLATKLEERAKEFVDSVKGVAEDGFEDHVLEEQFME